VPFGTGHDYSFLVGLHTLTEVTRLLSMADISSLKRSLPRVLESVCPSDIRYALKRVAQARLSGLE
jgi:hypothetical protein